MVKQIIASGTYKNPVLQQLADMEYFYIDKKGRIFDKDRKPFLNNDVQVQLGSLK